MAFSEHKRFLCVGLAANGIPDGMSKYIYFFREASLLAFQKQAARTIKASGCGSLSGPISTDS